MSYARLSCLVFLGGILPGLLGCGGAEKKQAADDNARIVLAPQDRPSTGPSGEDQDRPSAKKEQPEKVNPSKPSPDEVIPEKPKQEEVKPVEGKPGKQPLTKPPQKKPGTDVPQWLGFSPDGKQLCSLHWTFDGEATDHRPRLGEYVWQSAWVDRKEAAERKVLWHSTKSHPIYLDRTWDVPLDVSVSWADGLLAVCVTDKLATTAGGKNIYGKRVVRMYRLADGGEQGTWKGRDAWWCNLIAWDQKGGRLYLGCALPDPHSAQLWAITPALEDELTILPLLKKLAKASTEVPFPVIQLTKERFLCPTGPLERKRGTMAHLKDFSTGNVQAVFQAAADKDRRGVGAMTATADARIFAVEDVPSKHLLVWRGGTGGMAEKLAVPEKYHSPGSLVLSPDGEYLAWTNRNLIGAKPGPSVFLWHLPSGTARTIDHLGDVRQLAFSPTQPNLLAAGASGGDTYLVDISTGMTLHTVRAKE